MADKKKTKKMNKKHYEAELFRLQLELVKLQAWVSHMGLKVVVLFEGRDAAGKGGVIKRISQHLNPRICRVAALPAPTEREQSQWYFQRYVPHLPAAGEMVLFDRSWYNRAGVEKVMGFCSDEEYQEFLRSCPEFERMLVRSGIILISVGKGDGVAGGMTFEVIRPNEYVGRVRVTDVYDEEAVCRVVLPMTPKQIREGDYVTTRLK